MSAPTDPTRDELASAYLDGELTPEEAVAVAADPQTMARVEQLGRTSELLGSTLAKLPADQAQSMIDRALDGVADSAAPPDAPLAPGDQIGSRRAARRRWLAMPAMAAAAVLLLMIVGVGLIISGSRSGDGKTSNAMKTASAPASANDAAAPSTAGAKADGESSSAKTLPDIGTFADAEGLRKALTKVDLDTLMPVTAATDATGGSAPQNPEAPTAASGRANAKELDRCEQSLLAIPGQSLGPLLATGEARLAGQRVFVFSHARTDAAPSGAPLTQLTVTDATSCVVQFAVQR